MPMVISSNLHCVRIAFLLVSTVGFLGAQETAQPVPQPPQSPPATQAQPQAQGIQNSANTSADGANRNQDANHRRSRRRKKDHNLTPEIDRPRPEFVANQGEQPGHSTPKQYVEYDLSKGTYSGETLRGPVTIWATHLNTIRWDYGFNSVSTYKAGPDLSASLTTAPVSTQPANTVAPASAPVVPAQSHPAAAADQGRAAAPAHRAAAAPKPPQALLDLVKQARELTTKAEDLDQRLRGDVQDVFTRPVNRLAELNTVLVQFQNIANNSVALLTQASAALQSYLKSAGNNIPDVVSQTRRQLANNSAFMEGVNAEWPAPYDVLKLQNELAVNSAEISGASKKIATYLSDVQSIEKNLAGVKDSLVTQNANYQTATADPATDKLVRTLVAAIDSDTQLLRSDESYANETTNVLTTATAQNQSATTNAALLSSSSPNYQSFTTASTTLKAWYDRMSTKLTAYNKWLEAPDQNPDPFAIYRDATCAFAFSGTKDTVITLTRVDLTPNQSTPAPETPLSVTVECTSPFSIAAGVVFSTIPDNEYEVASKTTTATDGTSATTSYIRQNSNSSFHPLPLALANVRLYEWSEHVAIYSSFGIAANIRGQNAGGSTAEYLIGPSVGFFRGIFLTVGAHIGNEVTVGGGYKVGDTLPSSQPTVPLSTNYHAGFGLGITFTKP